MKTRTEQDSLGTMEIPANCFYGIHTFRAVKNFPLSNYKVNSRLIRSMALVKLAAAKANKELGYLSSDIADAIIKASEEIVSNEINYSDFPLDALQGGAGTSTNMNINEVIANKSLELSGYFLGDYARINPIDHVNLHQSTNDVYPTALKVAIVFALRELSNAISDLQGAFQKKEKEFADVLTIGRTELQDAVPTTMGSIFSAFSEAIARDRWRTYKSEERIRTVNLGGTAIGTGLTAPRDYIFLVIEKLREITGLGLTRAENLMDATSNADPFVEVSGMLDANAVNLIKIASDLRLYHYFGEITLEAVQAGSSIMPGKVNPVIIESVISCGLKVLANHKLMSDCASRGSLQINEFLPLIAHSLLESLDLLINSSKVFASHVLSIAVNREVCREHFESNEMIVTAFLPYIGYDKSGELLEEFKSSESHNFRHFLSDKLGADLVDKVLSPEQITALGHRK